MTANNGWPGKPGALNLDGEVPTDELVRRLQHLGDWQAADRIEALQARVAELEEALQKKGCVRDQTTTQYCAEAAGLQARVAELEEALRDLLPEAIDHRYAMQSLAVVQARAALEGKKDE